MLWQRQPVHTVYGGAQLFKPATLDRLGQIARQALADFAPDPETFAAACGLPPPYKEAVYAKVVEKLGREPIEDFRIDFEDGFGVRSDAEEDVAADSAAGALSGAAPPYLCGIRIKALSGETRGRALRTLERFLTKARLPERFVVTLPKVAGPEEVAELAALLPPFVGLEVMIETPQAMAVLREIAAAGGRTTAAHFGPYDYTASLGITAAHQSLRHPACDFARSTMLMALAPTGVWLSDGPTTLLPIPQSGREVVHRAWREHYQNVRHALVNGFYQGWDLHPAQLPARYAAVFAFFLESMPEASERLRNFVDAAARATQIRGVFDDAATGQGLLNTFLRALNCGAISEEEAPGLTGLSVEELRTGSFARILGEAD